MFIEISIVTETETIFVCDKSNEVYIHIIYTIHIKHAQTGDIYGMSTEDGAHCG